MYTFRVEIHSDGLLIVGSYDLPNFRRVSDALNSRIQRYVSLRDVTIAPQSQQQYIQRIPQLLVDWGNATLVAILEEPPPPPDFQGATLPRATMPMMFFTQSFALRANFYKRSDMGLQTALDAVNDDFIPLSNAQIFPLNGGPPLNRNFVCIRRDRIFAMYNTQPIASMPDDALTTPPPEPVASEPSEAQTSEVQAGDGGMRDEE